MPETLLPLDPATPAGEITAKFDLSEEAEALLAEGMTADEFFRQLQKKKLHFDAIRMLTTVLHKLFTVEWAYTAVGSELNQELSDDDQALLDVTEQWLNEPNEVNRRAAMEAAEAAGYETPACWTAAAAGWTGGSLAPADLPVVPPADDLCAKAAGGALSMIAVQNSAQIEKRAGQLVDMGVQFAARRPVPEPLYSGAEPKPAKAEAPPAEKPAVPKAPPPPPPPPKPRINPPPPKPAPFQPPRPRRPEPPPQEPPGTWSTEPL